MGIYLPQSKNFEYEKKAALALPAKMSKAEKVNAELFKAATAENHRQPMTPALLDMADMELPDKLKEVFHWCRYFYKFDALIHAACNKLATFPVTPLEFHDKADGDTERDSDTLSLYKSVLMNKLDVINLLLLYGIDYYVYGNVFMFGEFEQRSAKPYDVEWSTVYRLDPNDVEIEVNPHTKEKVFKIHVSPKLKRIVNDKHPKEIYDKIPKTIRDAVTQNKMLVLNSKNVWHDSRPSESGDSSVYGTPIILPTFKLLMYRNLLRQSQLAIAKEHMVPTKLVYLNYNTNDVEMLDSLKGIASDLVEQLKKASTDPNHKVVSPIPVGASMLGGQGRSLLLVQELQATQDEILACMNLPREFVFGGVSYSSSSISLRVLENDFRIDRANRERFINEFLIKRMAQERREWSTEDDNDQLIKAKFSQLKMQDDVQQKSLIFNLSQAGKVDDETLYNALGLDSKKVKERIENEAIAKLELQQRITLKQLEVELEQQKKQYENQVQMMLFQQGYIQQLAAKMGMNPEELMMIASGQAMMPAGTGTGNQGQQDQRGEQVDNGAQVDDRPMPEQRPPRRNSLK